MKLRKVHSMIYADDEKKRINFKNISEFFFFFDVFPDPLTLFFLSEAATSLQKNMFFWRVDNSKLRIAMRWFKIFVNELWNKVSIL